MNKLLQVALILSVVSVIEAEHHSSEDDAEAQELIPLQVKDLKELSDVEVRFVHRFFTVLVCRSVN